MFKPLVSIITICFNSEKTIEKTIESVINQTYKNIEYIVVDGSSKDNTINIIKKYTNNIGLFISEPDSGIAEAFNKGLKNANGELVGIINSDDWYEVDTVERIVKKYINNPSFDIFHGNLKIFNKDKELFVSYPDRDYEKLKYKMIVNHPTCFVKKSLYEECGFFSEKYKIGMDHELLLRFYKNGAKFYYLNEILSNMQITGISNKRPFLVSKERFNISRQYNVSLFKALYYFFSLLIKDRIIKSLGDNSFLVKSYRKIKTKHNILKHL